MWKVCRPVVGPFAPWQREQTSAAGPVTGSGAVTEAPPAAFNYLEWISAAAAELAAEAIVLDVRDELGLEAVRAIRRRTRTRISVIDDISDRRLGADDVFLPPIRRPMPSGFAICAA